MADECEDRASESENLAALPRAGKIVSPVQPPKEAVEPLTMSIKDAARLLGLGRSTIYRLMGEGHLHPVKIGNRTLIKMASIRRIAEGQD